MSPDNKISGGKVLGKGRMSTNNRATTVLRMAATTLRESDSYLGEGAQFYEAQHRKHQVIHLKRKAAQLGFQIIEVAAAA